MSLRQWVLSLIDERLAQRGVGRHGIVSSVDPKNGLVKVQYDENGDAVSGWLPICQQAVGNGWGVVTLPLPGTQVYVAPDMGDITHGVVMGAVHSTQQPIGQITPYMGTSPMPLVPGEPTLISASGASIRMTDGAVIELHAATVKITGDLLVSGEITDHNDAHDNLNYLRQAYNNHVHPGVVPGSSNTQKTLEPTP